MAHIASVAVRMQAVTVDSEGACQSTATSKIGRWRRCAGEWMRRAVGTDSAVADGGACSAASARRLGQHRCVVRLWTAPPAESHVV